VDAAAAGKLLNEVRKRNYPQQLEHDTVCPEGSATLDMKEMLNEWGREFFAEGRRRSISSASASSSMPVGQERRCDDHTLIFPFHRDILVPTNT
jgi:hypothetical protein